MNQTAVVAIDSDTKLDNGNSGYYYCIMWLVFSSIVLAPVLALSFLSIVRFRKVKAEIRGAFTLLKVVWGGLIV